MAVEKESFVDEGIIASNPRPTHTARMDVTKRRESLIQLAKQSDGKAHYYGGEDYAQYRRMAFEARKQAREIEND